ncbi:MAG TPA: serine/threonine-protein kinase [Nocardioides sp.]|uniref:serine/threonine-protein kinase n=1 Tax=Nocardioides sp. TaxID=35761 RepID=UPI002C8ED095|nr:serine/threonine-protein kinase [Nocardioides sp.]HTW13480.1 serine/threonine-protein kinase [Nocardioides sp.]
MPRPEAPAPRMSVGDYTLLAKIGEGGMGVVHLARHADGDRVALKVLRPHIVGDDEARARLAREVSSLERIRSRWVAEIVDADPWAPVPYVATRYVPGLSLHDHVVEEGPIEGRDLLWFAGCLAEGLASVHAVGVLHRDVKPSNVLMEGRTPILIDFGLARVADDPKLTHTGWLLGTPGYLAPEILYGEDASAASDVHSWAATVAYAGTGRAPFGRGPSMAIMDRVRRGEHDLTGLPEGLRGVVESALDPDPARRPRLGQLLAWLRPQSTRAGARGPVPTTPVAEDVYTLPLAIASASAVADDPTDRWPDAELQDELPPPTRRETEYSTQALPADGPPPQQVWPEDWWQQQDGAWPAEPEPTTFAERFRRGTLLVLAAVAAGAGIAAYPWWATIVVLLLVWVLRSGSLAASKAGDRRRLRGRRWYDGAQFLIGAPWDLVRSIPGTLMLVLWSAGLAVAGGLVCYAVAATVPVGLFVCGTVLAASLWSGPGGSRVRSPLARVVHPLASDVRRWAVALVVLGLLAAGLALIAGDGTAWGPSGDPAGWTNPLR